MSWSSDRSSAIGTLYCYLVALAFLRQIESAVPSDSPMWNGEEWSSSVTHKCLGCAEEDQVCQSTCTCLQDHGMPHTQPPYGLFYIYYITLDWYATMEVKQDNKLIGFYRLSPGRHKVDITDVINSQDVCFYGSSVLQEKPPRLAAGSIYATCFNDMLTLPPRRYLHWDREGDSHFGLDRGDVRLWLVAPGVYLESWDVEYDLPVRYVARFSGVPDCLSSLDVAVQEFGLPYEQDERPVRKICKKLTACKSSRCLQPRPVYPVLVDDLVSIVLSDAVYEPSEKTGNLTKRTLARLEIELSESIRPEDVCFIARMAMLDSIPFGSPAPHKMSCSPKKFDFVRQSLGNDAILDRLRQMKHEVGELDCTPCLGDMCHA